MKKIAKSITILFLTIIVQILLFPFRIVRCVLMIVYTVSLLFGNTIKYLIRESEKEITKLTI